MRKISNNIRAARALRKAMTLPEGLLWRELRGRKHGLKIRRQHPVGPYVLDFYCAAAKTGFEIDGVAHDLGDNPTRDAERDAWLAQRGIRVVRIQAKDVLIDPVCVAEMVLRLAAESC